MAALLIGAPRFTGACQSHARQRRCDIQISRLPRPPVRVETKKSVCASDERPALASTELEFTTGPRFTGSDHSELAKRSACSTKAIGSDSARHASSKRSGAKGMQRRCAVVIGTSLIREAVLLYRRDSMPGWYSDRIRCARNT